MTLSIDAVTREYVRMLNAELKYRDLVIKPVEYALRKHGDGCLFTDDPRQFFQCFQVMEYISAEREWTLENYSNTRLKPLAIAHALQITRPFPIQFSTMEMPHGCYEVCRECWGGVSVRAVTNYHIESDRFYTRFDTLVCWEDNEVPPFGGGPSMKL